ncbi:MAG TPA: hypothetical protein VMU09_12345, partial [Acidimicrobiales bacterium]|nr:hypothetical protein [Acidimicrobiales bacterium]
GADDSEASRRALARETIAAAGDEPFGLYLFRADDPAADLARHVEQQVFLETFGNTPELLAKEYLPYEEASVFLCVMDHRRAVPVSAMRIVTPSPAGFKSLDDIAPVWNVDVETMFERTGIPFDPGTIWDIATIAAHPEYRGKAAAGLATLALYQGLAHASLGSGIETLVCVLDLPVFRMMQGVLQGSFDHFEGVEPRPYLGSPASLPVYLVLEESKRRMAAADRHMYEICYEGRGLEEALRPLDLDGALRDIAEVRLAVAGRTGIGRR